MISNDAVIEAVIQKATVIPVTPPVVTPAAHTPAGAAFQKVMETKHEVKPDVA